MTTVKFNSIPTKILSDSITSSATAFKLNNINGWDGSALTSADFGDTGYGVFRNATNTEIEFFAFDPSTIADSEITITLRGLYYNAADLTTEVTANKKNWTKGDTYVDLGTDTPQMLQWMKEYIDTASIAGAVPATPSVQGIAKLSTAAADAAQPIVVGDNDARVPTTNENDAMAGGGDLGTPSTSNKYITQDGLSPAISDLYDAVSFVTIESQAASSGLATTAVAPTMPSGVTSGDIVLFFLNIDGGVSVAPTGYTEIVSPDDNVWVYAKIATGSDTFSLTGSVTDDWSAIGYRLSNTWGATTVTDIVKGSEGLNTENPPVLNPDNQYGFYTWFVGCGHVNTGTYDTAPSGYSGLTTEDSGAADSGQSNIATAYKNLRAIDENPGAFSTTGTLTNRESVTVSVRAAETFLT